MAENVWFTGFSMVPIGETNNAERAIVNGFAVKAAACGDQSPKKSRRRNVQESAGCWQDDSSKNRRFRLNLTKFSVKQLSNNSEKEMSFKSCLIVAVLFFVNLLNYMDRFTIAGVLTELQHYYSIGDWEAGLLQTVFISFYMVFAPLFGYLGDRYSRKKIIIAGVVVWSGAVFVSTFVPSNHFLLFLLLRGVVGVGEASYATVSITILGDLFSLGQRLRMLTIFFFAVPLGSGLGFIVGSVVTKYTGGIWQWGVRITPILGIVCIVLIVFLLDEPKRGASEQHHAVEMTSWRQDLRYLCNVQSYVWSTFGFTCVAFVVGSLSWWTPNYIIYSQRKLGIVPDNAYINTVFGLIMCSSGFLGVGVGSAMANAWQRTNARAEPLVCAIGLIISVPFLFTSLLVVVRSLTAAWCFVFITITALCLNWSILSNILLSVVVPNRRSTASALQILTSHVLGDAISPYIVGQISDWIRGRDTSPVVHFESLRYALYGTPFACLLGAFFFFGCAWFIERDRKKMILAVSGMSSDDKEVEGESDNAIQPSIGPIDTASNYSQDLLVPHLDAPQEELLAIVEPSPNEVDLNDKKSS